MVMGFLSGIANAIFGVGDNGYGARADNAMKMAISTAQGAIATPNPEAAGLARAHLQEINQNAAYAKSRGWNDRTMQVMNQLSNEHYFGLVGQATGIARQQLEQMYQSQSGLYSQQSAQAQAANSAAMGNMIDLGTNIAAGNVFPNAFKAPQKQTQGEDDYGVDLGGIAGQRAGAAIGGITGFPVPGPVPLGGWGSPGNPLYPSLYIQPGQVR
jgi:hypothetical protein